MSKYAQLRAAMGGKEDWNDKVSTGRVLKWQADTCGADKQMRDKMAEMVMSNLRVLGVRGVQKVQVRNWLTIGDCRNIKSLGSDKICVYVDAQML